jgi:hypothetical protein
MLRHQQQPPDKHADINHHQHADTPHHVPCHGACRFDLLREGEATGDGRKAFHYGTHYSSAAIVLYYLLRMQPFTEQHVRLQVGGRARPRRGGYRLGVVGWVIAFGTKRLRLHQSGSTL